MSDALTVLLQNDKELRKAFEEMQQVGKRSTLLSTFRKVAKPIIRKVRQNLNSRRKHDPGQHGGMYNGLYKSIGTSPVRGEAALNVGSRRKKNKFAGHHANFLEYGTVQRRTKRGVNRGRIRGTHFFSDAVESEKDSALKGVAEYMRVSIVKYWERRAKRSQSTSKKRR
ncbi:hypothetical protein [Marinifilum flexuosum]|uniref:hypothetical protein n=1 Tax=Marinifilum flexuosum TaxID=1117708 RepID=UPI0024947F2B|nr:hypothetical protein [Marinifilum flexuosum]